MGCPCEIQLFAASETQANSTAKLAITDIRRLEARYSRYRDDSLLSEINRVAAKGGSIVVDQETAALLDYADTCYQQSEGLFDITSGILRRAWRFEQNELPKQSLIDMLLNKVGWDKLRWADQKLELPLPGLELDFGGIVKEYAADRAANLCQNAGANSGVINLGGDIKIIGPRSDGRPWRIGLGGPNQANPNQPILMMHQGAVASSGDYERCMTINGIRYSHILNPKTGWPVRHMAAVSVVGDFCVVAGSASTIAMLKEQAGSSWLEKMGLPHLWTDAMGNQGGPLLK
ncbi:FAD:protein FMN transferase [Methylomonas sp. LL1]|uniref:FAD:protein FMN transferase n=1 Tax=Methylomonas sp. LL1 TaxID=2785785 RepID=UPI0018C41067|nr:FAD:protein FMN transferase [Methylomonas sp. LL1]QPK63969.1 FAD:protein FMN transferase [Methylomonas sp. LL1]